MTHTQIGIKRFVVVIASLSLLLVSAISTEAGQRRARLSRDLSERLAVRADAPVDVIVTAGETEVDTLATRYGARVKKRLRNGAVLEVTGGQLADLSEDADVAAVAGDVPVRTMSVTTTAIGADQVWSGAAAGPRGFSGRGVGVVVIDTGVDPRHPRLASRVALSLDFTDDTRLRGRDENGHGTHVAGLVAEVAPGAHIISLKTMGADGSGQTSNVLAAFDWAIEHRRKWNIKVINLSLGHPILQSEKDDPLCQAVKRATDEGILVTVAAGNVGKTLEGTPIVGGIWSPGNSPSALTVGALNTLQTAVRSDDVMATYSSRGPTMIDGVLKPELVAPGNRLVSAVPRDGYLPRTYPERVVGRGADVQMELSGTSMSCAVTAGAAALLLESRPMRPRESKLLLQFTSSRVAGSGLIEAGAGSLNIVAAVGVARGRADMADDTTIAGEPQTPSLLAYRHTSLSTDLA